MRRILLAAMMCGVTAGAQAADLSDLPILRGAFTEGLSNSKVNWQGYYVGGQADYGSITSKMPSGINSDLQSTFFPPPGVTYNWLGLGQARSTNSGYGAFAGYNSQWDDVVLGLEANYLHGGFRANSASTGYTYLNDNVTIASTTHSSALVTLSDFGSLRVRAGYVMGCFLPYVYLGGGFGSRTVDRNVSAVPDSIRSTLSRDSQTKLIYGYSAGLGMDVMLVGGLFARAEYEYLRVTSTAFESTVNTVRAGIGYKF